MHFTYEPALSKTDLMQGDVLARTPAINKLLEEVHPHFRNPKNLFFMVLTQSCDLVQRGPGKLCKARYIAIAPVRALDLVVERHFAQQNQAEVRAALPVRGHKSKGKATEFLQRLFNNNESGFFYLDAEDTELPTDCVAFLNLSIALRAELHFHVCLESKVLQLNEAFQAKLGWLVGQLYSRVGTQDWPATTLSHKIKKILADAAIWVDDGHIGALETAYREFATRNPNAAMTFEKITDEITRLPSRKQRVIKRAASVISEALGPEGEVLADRLRRRLESDAALTGLLTK
jgi:hypothetical protein